MVAGLLKFKDYFKDINDEVENLAENYYSHLDVIVEFMLPDIN